MRAEPNQPNVVGNPNATAPFLPILVLRPDPPTPRSGRLPDISLFHCGHTDIKELALYVQDTITKGNWSLQSGLRGDFYNGLTTHSEAEPRLGIAYNIKKTNTVLRVSYARVLETPFNENLVLASIGCADPVLNPLLVCSTPDQVTPFSPGWRNEFHAGFQQAFGKYLVFSGEYIWKYTHNAYDFSVLGARRSPFRSSGTTRRFPDLRAA